MLPVCVKLMLYGSETWSVQKDDMMKIMMDDSRMVKWIRNVNG